MKTNISNNTTKANVKIFVDNKNRNIYSKYDGNIMSLISTYKKNIMTIQEWSFKAMLFQQFTGMTKTEAEDAACIISMIESIDKFFNEKDYMTSLRTFVLVKIYFEHMKKSDNYCCSLLYDNIKDSIREMNQKHYHTWYNFLKKQNN